MHILHILSLGTISPCPLIMDAADGVSITSFQARPESSIHLLLHLSISSLDGAQIPLTAVVPLDLRAKTCSHILGKTGTKLPVINCAYLNGGGRSSTHTNPVHRPSNLHHLHS